MRRTICIVDAYSTGASLAVELRTRGETLVHIQSMEHIPEVYVRTFQPSDFDVCLSGTQLYQSLKSRLIEAGVTKVIAGAEPGIAMADSLAASMNVEGNSPQTSVLRRDKFLMNEAVRAAGRDAVRQANATSATDAVEVARKWDAWPIVVKPINSAGSDGVTFCYDQVELKAAALRLLGTRNRLGLQNTSVLLQERLVGQQYIINSVSLAGSHYVTEIWRDDRREVSGAGLVYEREVMLGYEGELQRELIEYTCASLTAIGLEYGPAHTEIMYTAKGPMLIEVGARMQGSICAPAVEEAIGASHVTATADWLTEPSSFARKARRGYKIRKNLQVASLISSQEGYVVATRLWDLVSQLPSFHTIIGDAKPGEYVRKTIDLFSSPGVIYLANDSAEQIERDYLQIRAWEAKGEFFVLRSKVADDFDSFASD